MKKIFIILILVSFQSFGKSNDNPNLNFSQNNQISWENWIDEIKLKYKDDFSDKTLNYLDTISLNKRVIELDRSQPEFTLTFNEYFKKHVSKKKIEQINQKFNKNNNLLSKIKQKYKVNRKIIVSLWGIETSFGNYLGKFDILRSLASLAYDGRRRDFFLNELKKALFILDKNHVSADKFKGSWAGAFGQTQFMPSTFTRYAVDFDKNKKIDLFSKIDALASAANYLAQEGWNENLLWGEKVKLKISDKFKSMAKKKVYKSIKYWENNGIMLRKNYNKNDKLRLIIPDSIDNQVFLVSKNFDVILKWNRSNYFALTVFLLSDEIDKNI